MARRFGLSRLVRLTLLAAFLMQCVLVQTHVHFAQLSAAPTSATLAKSAVPGSDKPEHCPLCWEAAMAGHFTLPDVVELPAADPLPPWVAASFAAAFALARQPHGWLSRAPPE